MTPLRWVCEAPGPGHHGQRAPSWWATLGPVQLEVRPGPSGLDGALAILHVPRADGTVEHIEGPPVVLGAGALGAAEVWAVALLEVWRERGCIAARALGGG